MENFNHLKKWLKPKIASMGLNVTEFAERVGLSRAAVYHYFNDVNRPDEVTMRKMCAILGADPEEGLKQYTHRKEGNPWSKIKS